MCLFVHKQIGFAAADSVSGLKLIEAGVPKETLAMLAIPMIPIQILLPLYISRYTSGKFFFFIFSCYQASAPDGFFSLLKHWYFRKCFVTQGLN